MINWAKAGLELIDWLLLMVKVVIVGAVILLLIFLWRFMFGFKHSEFNQVALTSSSKSDLVVTSFAQVDLLSLKRSSREILIPGPDTVHNYEQVVNEEFGKAKAFCLHSYEVVFGYPSLSAERKRNQPDGGPPVAEPGIVAVNTLRSENAPDSSTRWCQQKNLKNRREALKQELRFALEFDEVLHEHLTHGQMVLASVLDLGTRGCRSAPENDQAKGARPDCRITGLSEYWETQSLASRALAAELKTGIAEKNAALTAPDLQQAAKLEMELASLQSQAFRLETSAEAQEKAANRGADVAGLVLTFSNTLGISQERKRFLGLWTSKSFYLQRDIAKVYYGTQLSPTSIDSSWNLLGPKKVVIKLAKPNIIAINRYSSFVVARNKTRNTQARQSLSNYLNEQILENLEFGIKRFHSRAVKAAESILVNRVPGYFALDGLAYEVTFKSAEKDAIDLSFLPGVLDLTASDTGDEE